MRPLAALILAALLATTPLRARAADPLAFGLDWRAEAEYGGFYQALATGLYQAAGLDVSIRQGGPQVNQTQFLLAGRLDAAIASNSFLALNFAREGLPLRAVAAMFQRDPAVLIAHPGRGNDNFAALKGKPILIGADSRSSWWPFLRARFGYDDAQIRPYTFNLAPFLANPDAVQQGYLGSEPWSIRQATGTMPVVLLLADAGFTGYGSLVTAGPALLARRPGVLTRFLAATAAGWTSYLHADPTPANKLIKQENPEMTDDLLSYGRQALIDHGIVESGDALAGGIGVMTDARWAGFVQAVTAQGLYPADLNWHAAYDLSFLPKP